MINVKGLTELGFNNDIRKPDVVRAYVNDYGVIVDVQETPYGLTHILIVRVHAMLTMTSFMS